MATCCQPGSLSYVGLHVSENETVQSVACVEALLHFVCLGTVTTQGGSMSVRHCRVCVIKLCRPAVSAQPQDG